MDLDVQGPFYTRIVCWNHTRQRVAQLALPPPPEMVKVDCQDAAGVGAVHARHDDTCVLLYDMDPLDCTLHLGGRAGLMNVCEGGMPGGLVAHGVEGLEEGLFQCTNLCLTLPVRPDLIPIREDQAVHSPGVSVLKAANGAALVAAPAVNVITCAGLGPEPQPARFTHQLRAALHAVQACGLDAVVLTMHACAASKMPVATTVHMYCDVLVEFSGALELITITVPTANLDATYYTAIRDAIFGRSGTSA